MKSINEQIEDLKSEYDRVQKDRLEEDYFVPFFEVDDICTRLFELCEQQRAIIEVWQTMNHSERHAYAMKRYLSLSDEQIKARFVKHDILKEDGTLSDTLKSLLEEE